MFLEIPLESVLTEEVKTLLTAHNLRAVGVGLMVEPDVPGGEFHVVKPGETLTSIAKEHNTTVKKLVEINQLTNPNHIIVGQVIFLN